MSMSRVGRQQINIPSHPHRTFLVRWEDDRTNTPDEITYEVYLLEGSEYPPTEHWVGSVIRSFHLEQSYNRGYTHWKRGATKDWDFDVSESHFVADLDEDANIAWVDDVYLHLEGVDFTGRQYRTVIHHMLNAMAAASVPMSPIEDDDEIVEAPLDHDTARKIVHDSGLITDNDGFLDI